MIRVVVLFDDIDPHIILLILTGVQLISMLGNSLSVIWYVTNNDIKHNFGTKNRTTNLQRHVDDGGCFHSVSS